MIFLLTFRNARWVPFLRCSLLKCLEPPLRQSNSSKYHHSVIIQSFQPATFSGFLVASIFRHHPVVGWVVESVLLPGSSFQGVSEWIFQGMPKNTIPWVSSNSTFWKVLLLAPPGNDHISPKKMAFWVDDFPNFPRWDMLIPWRVCIFDVFFQKNWPWGLLGLVLWIPSDWIPKKPGPRSEGPANHQFSMKAELLGFNLTWQWMDGGWSATEQMSWKLMEIELESSKKWW